MPGEAPAPVPASGGEEADRARVSELTLELAHLQARINASQALLRHLLQDIAAAATSHQAQHAPLAQVAHPLREANGELVRAALRAQTEADTATQALEVVSRSAELDALTGLPNRVLLRDRLARAIASAERKGGRLALLFVDLDHFKQINDTLGHAVGDAVLEQVAQRLVQAVRATDTVSRHGGDEFLVLLSEVNEAADAARMAGKLIRALIAPLQIGARALQLSASIGVSLYPDDGTQTDVLIGQADHAMYRAKRSGSGRIDFASRPGSAAASPDTDPD